MSKVALEVAEVEFERFIDLMAIDADVDDMDEDDEKEFHTVKRKIVKAICLGSLVINDDGEPVFTPQRSDDKESITFHEPTGASYAAANQKKISEVGKMYSVMADMTKTHAALFSKMKAGDLNVCTSITKLFLG